MYCRDLERVCDRPRGWGVRRGARVSERISLVFGMRRLRGTSYGCVPMRRPIEANRLSFR